MTTDVLQARTEKWPMSGRTPEDVASLLTRSRRMFVDGYYTYENFSDAATRSLQAVEAALRVRLGAGTGKSFADLSKLAKAQGLISEEVKDVLEAGRMFRNDQIHATRLSVLTPAMAAGMIETSHKMVAELFEVDSQPPSD